MPCWSKKSFLSDLPPGKAIGLTGKSAQGVALAGEGFPRQEAYSFRLSITRFALPSLRGMDLGALRVTLAEMPTTDLICSEI